VSIPTEAEIWACLSENMRLAAEDCEKLARLPIRGPTYLRLLEELKLITGACRALAWCRDDAGGVGAPVGFSGTHGLEAVQMGENDSAGWLEVSHMMGTLHQKIGDWLRSHYRGPLFLKAATVLREIHRQMQRRHDRPLGRSPMTQGALMPPMRPGPHRESRPVQVKAPGAIVLPPGFKDKRAA